MATLRTYSATIEELGPFSHWRLNELEGPLAADREERFSGTYQGSFRAVEGVIGDGAAALDGSAFVEIVSATPAEPVRLAFIGDSMVAGFGLDPADAFPDDLVEALEAEGFAIDPIVDGLNGRQVNQAGGAVDSVLAQDPDVVVLVLGANDSLRSRDPQTVKNELDDIIGTFSTQGVAVLLTGTFGLWPDEIYGEPGYDDTTDPENAQVLAAQFEAIFPELATENPEVALFNPFHGGERQGTTFVGGVLGDPSLNQGDGVHPNAAGVDAIVADILPQARELVAAAAGSGEDPLAIAQGTIEMWFVPAAIDGVQALFTKDAEGTGAGQIRAVLNGQGRVVVTLESASGEAVVRSPVGSVAAGDVTQVVVTFGPAGLRLFLNGERVEVADSATEGLVGNVEPLLIGADPLGQAATLDGTVDEFVVYDRVLTGTEISQLFEAGSRGNTLVGTAERDILLGGPDGDVMSGLDGSDDLFGAAGADTLRGGPAGDLVLGQGGDDTLFGGRNADQVRGGAGNDVIAGGAGHDLLIGGIGDDQLFGEGGADVLRGLDGSDFLDGANGGDTLRGGQGPDQLEGGKGNDVIFGGAGSDVLSGGAGFDILTGGADADTFRIQSLGQRVDTITDFEPGSGGDALDVRSLLQGFEPGSSDPAAFIELSEANGSTKVAVNADGSGDDALRVFNLQSLTGLDLGQLVADGNVVLS